MRPRSDVYALRFGAMLVVVLSVMITSRAAAAGDPVGACCFCNGCAVVTAVECGALGGTYQGDGSACTALCTVEVNMPDANLRAAVQAELGGCLLTEFNLLGLTYLDAYYTEITDLTGLEYAVNLSELELESCQITDVSPLATLTNLTYLYLVDNLINDISPLAGLTNLTSLSLSYNQISDISPLSGLTNLTGLSLYDNQISVISPLSGMTNLTWLSLGNNQITDISPLAGMTNMTELWLGNNQITDISPLAGMTNMTKLYLTENQISDISPLVGMTSLTWLYLYDNQISDISPLAGLTNLTWLSLDDNQISVISPLSGLTNLTHLSLGNNQITTISPLAGLTSLTWLSLASNQITDISAVSAMTVLGFLSAYGNQISDISPLAELTSLWVLDLWDNQIADVSPLAGLTNLGGLYIGSNPIADIAPLAGLVNLQNLGLWSVLVTDISPIAGLTNLSTLYLSGNQITDLSPLAGLTNLTQLYAGGGVISDISPLAVLANLTEVHLDENYISDVSPLVELTNLQLLDLLGNPLDLAARCTDIPLIQGNNPDAVIAYDDAPRGACCLVDNSCLENVSQALCDTIPDNLSWSECATCADVGCDPSGFFSGAWGGSWFDPANWGGGSLPDANADVFITVEVVIDQPGAVARTVSLVGDGDYGNGGFLVLEDGSLTAQTVTLAPGTAIIGTGTITADVINGGGIAPGVDPETGLPVGTLTIVGSYVQTSTGELYLELAGVDEFDRLDVSAGDATLDGVLYVQILDVFQPAPPAETLLDVIPAASRTGMFGAVYTDGLWPDTLITVDYAVSGTTSLRVVDLTEVIDFEPPLVFEVADLPSDAVVASFDDDPEGFIDLAVSVPALDSVFVLFNNGNDVDGTWLGFGGSTQVPVGVAPSGITAADFDLDFDPDLATSNAGGVGTVTAIRNLGEPPYFMEDESDTITVGAEPSDITAGTYDGDAFPDLAVTNRADGTVSVLIGAGDATFTANDAFPVGNQPIAIETGEFDGGPGIDLIVVTPAVDPADDGAVVVLAGQGDGTFDVGTGITVGALPGEVDPADVDNDKDVDAVVVNRGSESVTVLLGDGTGALVPVIELFTDGPPSSVAVFNMDTEPAPDRDIAVAVNDDDLGRLVRIFRNDLENGQLAFVQDQDQAVALEPVLVLSGDVDRDGLEDLITINDDSGAAPGGAAVASVGVLLNESYTIVHCPGDGDGDGSVDFADLLIVLAQWGTCQLPADCDGDHNGDEVVSFADLLIVLANWGTCSG